MPRKLVLDASVARSCSTTQSPPAPECFTALEAIRGGALQVTVSVELRAEWERHASRYFWQWLRDMTSRRRVTQDRLVRVEEISGRLRRLIGSAEAEAVAKDAHLAAAGVEHGGRVLSLDGRMRDKLARVATADSPWHELGLVHWADPSIDPHKALCAWLRSDAPEEEPRQLRSWGRSTGRPSAT
jgi:hypothetical protein